MNYEVLYESKSTGSQTMEICDLPEGQTKESLQKMLDESKNTTGVGRVIVGFKKVDPENDVLIKQMQRIDKNPGMYGQYLDWSKVREIYGQ